jgi:hypothetical protein
MPRQSKFMRRPAEPISRHVDETWLQVRVGAAVDI